MAIEQNFVDQFNTNNEEISQAMMKIQHTNLGLNPSLEVYPEELHMIVLIMNNSVLNHALSSSFAILMHQLSLATSITVYNKTTKVVTF